MITKPTLFVLGAGASIPYGFPSGLLLRNWICEASTGRHSTLATRLSINSTISALDVTDFAKCFMHSRIASIDSFLSRRPEYAEIGKAVIAALLIPIEKDTAFDAAKDDDWYFNLWNALVSGAGDLSELVNNQVKIFTFNYDRSLETYIYNAIINTFANVTQEQALEALSYFNIKHVYGSLGQFNVEDSRDSRIYRPHLNELTLDVAIKGIKVIPEARDDDSIFNEAKESFRWAQNVCFLGFGYDTLNVQRLGFREIVESRDDLSVPSNIVASTFGLTDAEVSIARYALTGGMQFHGKDTVLKPVWSSLKRTNLQTLREHAWLLS